jgi:hypothetical protein
MPGIFWKALTRMRTLLGALLLWAVAPSTAPAQDAMALDLALKNGLVRVHGPEGRQDSGGLQRSDEARDAEGRVQLKKRHVRRRRG